MIQVALSSGFRHNVVIHTILRQNHRKNLIIPSNYREIIKWIKMVDVNTRRRKTFMDNREEIEKEPALKPEYVDFMIGAVLLIVVAVVTILGMQ